MRTFLVAGLEEGRNPTTLTGALVGRIDRASGRRTGGLLGLNSVQTDYVISARAELLSGDPRLMANYLRRARRDARFDRAVLAAIRDGRPVPAREVDRITGRYQDRLLAWRAETVGRSEAITALRAGRHEGFAQLVDSGKVRDEQIVRTWDATGDRRTRPDHLAMDGQKVVGLNAPFTAPDGARMMYPGDTSLGAAAKHTVNCRCFEKVRIRYIDDSGQLYGADQGVL